MNKFSTYFLLLNNREGKTLRGKGLLFFLFMLFAYDLQSQQIGCISAEIPPPGISTQADLCKNEDGYCLFSSTGPSGTTDLSKWEFSVGQNSWMSYDQLPFSKDGKRGFNGYGVGNHTVWYRQKICVDNITSFNFSFERNSNPGGYSFISSTPSLICNGQSLNNGILKLLAVQDVPPYHYTLNNLSTGEEFSGQAMYESGDVITISGLPSGFYSLKIKNSEQNSCDQYIDGIVISETSESPIQTSFTPPPSVPYCSDGAISLSVSTTGGTPPYSYYVHRPGGGVWLNSNQLTQLYPIGAEQYSLLTKDANGCTHSKSFTLPKTPSIEILNLIPTPPSNCNLANGAIEVQATGASNLQYKLRNASGSVNTAWGSIPIFNNLAAGDYTVEVRAAGDNNCQSSKSITLQSSSIRINQVVLVAPTGCGNQTGRIEVNAALYGAGTLQYTLQPAQGNFVAQWKEEGSFAGLNTGSYLLSIKSSSNCTKDTLLKLNGPIAPTASITTTPASSCTAYDGQLRISARPPGFWEYSIDGGLSYQRDSIFRNLNAKTYRIKVIGLDTSCFTTQYVSIGSLGNCVDICSGDSIQIGVPLTGSPPFCLQWEPSQGLLNPAAAMTKVAPSLSTRYKRYSIDNQGNITDSLLVEVRVNTPPQLDLTPKQLNLCTVQGQQLRASTGLFTYQWQTPSGAVVQGSNTYEPTQAGLYILRARGDSTGCWGQDSAIVEKTKLGPPLSLTLNDRALCGDSVLITAPSSYHTYLWTLPNGSTHTGGTQLSATAVGHYHLKATYAQGCIDEAEVQLIAPPFGIALTQSTDQIDWENYRIPQGFLRTLSGTGRQTLGLPNPEGKMVTLEVDKGCYDCGTVSIEVRDSLSSDSTLCQKTVHRAWIARNECGRRSVAWQTIAIKDQKAPYFIDFPTDSLRINCGTPLPDEIPRAKDNSGRKVAVILQQTQKIARGACDTLLIRHWRAVDSCGNDSTRMQYILIKNAVNRLAGVVNPHPCGTPYQQPQLNQTLRETLQADDVIWIYGFPVKIWEVTGGNGLFSGVGLLTLPFQQQTVKVSFSNIQVNADGKVIYGTMQTERAPNQVPFRCKDPQEADFCPTYTHKKDSLANIARQAANGFKDCLWTGKAPAHLNDIDRKFDPNGFDCKGIHRSGKTSNEIGCTQSEMNDPKNGKCYGKIQPWYWATAKDTLGITTAAGTALAEQLKDSLRTLVAQELADLIIELEQVYQLQRSKCDELRLATRNAFYSLGLPDSTYVFGSKAQYVKPGMWRQFIEPPKVLSLSAGRQSGVVALETNHVKLYPCDKKEEELETVGEEAQKLQNEQAKGELIQWLTELIRRLPEDSVKTFQNRELLNDWINRQIASRANQNAAVTFRAKTSTEGAANGGFYQQEAPSRKIAPFLSSQPALPEYQEALDQIQAGIAAKAKAQQVRIQKALQNGDQWIEGTHRAFYLQDIIRQRSASFQAPNDPASDTGAALLPLAIKKDVGGRNYWLILDNISFNASSGGLLDAYLILPSPGSGKDSVVFEALNVPFTPGGANYNNARLKLKCDAPLRLNDIAQLKLLGGDQTYIEWDCGGFSKLHLAAEVEFCRNVLVPYAGENLQPAPDSVRLKAVLSTYITSWDDFTMGVTFSHTFGLSEEGGFLFNVSDAYIDMSDTKTPSNISFPENYPFAEVADRNTWKGFYMKQFSVYLPQDLDKSRTPRGVTLNDLIIDDAGVSVVASLPGPIVPLQDGNLDGWAFSIDSVLVKILRNKFTGAGFGGLVNVPLLNSTTGAEVSPEDCVRYTAIIENDNRFAFSVQPATGKRIGMWFAELNLKKSSNIQVTYANRRFYTKAVLNGVIKVNAADAIKIKIPDLEFQELTVSNTAPYFDPGIWSRPKSGVGLNAKLDGFDLGFDSIAVEGGANPSLGFKAHLGLGAENGSLSVSGGFKLKGRLDITSTGRQRWMPDGIQMQEFNISGSIKEVFTVNGFVRHYANQGVFGNCFWGGLDAQLTFLGGGAGIKAVVLMGTTNTPDSTKYFMVDAMGILPNGVGGPGLAIKGFGGGAWNKMSATDAPINLRAIDSDITQLPVGQSLSGIQYVPSAAAGLGLKASLALASSDGKIFNGLVSLSAQFKTGGALDEIALNGLGTMLKEVKYSSGGLPDSANASVRVGVKIKYSFSQKALDGILQINMIVPNALHASGVAKIHFSSEKWFIHLGTPQNPIRADLQMPLVSKIGGARIYLDVGSVLPPPTTLPSYFRDMGITSAIQSNPSAGGGVMFGAGLDLSANFDKLKPLYASMDVKLGADLALIDYGNAICSNTGDPIGINGWYATGQFYAFLKAAVGLQFKQKKFPIAELAVGAALQGKIPNPTFARGAVGGSYRIMGGLIKGKFNLQFTLGKDCGELEDGSGSEQSLEQNYEIIAALRPEEGTRNVATTTIPSADFRFPINSSLESFDETGNPVSYLVELDAEGVQLYETLGAKTIPARAILNPDGRVLKFQPFDVLRDSTAYTFKVRVKYSKNGTLIGQQEKTVSFTTGAIATNISAGNISASYPINGMQYFYPGEYAGEEKFIELAQGQADLFKGTNAPVAILLPSGGAQVWQGSVQYSVASKRIAFNFPNEILRPAQCYTLEIRRLLTPEQRANNNGGTLPPSLLTSINFCTSSYTTFAEKVAAFAQGASRSVNGSQIVLQGTTEPFDGVETGGDFGSKAWVSLEAGLGNNVWYQNQKKILYQSYRSKWSEGSFQFVPRARDGAAPEQAISWQSGGEGLQFNVLQELSVDFQDFINQVQDYEAELRSKCPVGKSFGYASAAPCSNCCILPEFLPSLNQLSPPNPPEGSYPVRLRYSVPGKGSGSSANVNFVLGAINPAWRELGRK